jgi:lipopolysaccharide/colanic/teichoic acid biosynthesis glycosyltransferase
MKRALDVVLAVSLLVLLCPMMALIALGVRLDSRGPALFIQPRVGLHGREFMMFKFRSMCIGAEQMLSSLAHLNRGGTRLIRIDDDPRVTRLGAILRRTSLDELPQLFNVVKGDMSLVGPRPLEPKHAALLSSRDLERLSVPQGITGLWQVTARDNPSFEEWARLDLEYIRRWSLPLDLGILLRTPLVVLRSARRTRRKQVPGECMRPASPPVSEGRTPDR